MNSQLLNVSAVDGPLLVFLYLLTGGVVAVLLVRRTSRRRALGTLAGIAAGGLFGSGLTWLVCDVWDAFGVSPTVATRLWVAGFFATLVLAGSGLIKSGRWRKAVAIVAIPLCLLTAAAGINVDFGEFTTVRAVLGIPRYGPLSAALASSTGARQGIIGTVAIPAPRSRFKARQALVYLPPAAQVAHPPVLPVVEMLSGQPGSPENVFTSGRLAAILDAYAASHAGYTPIVVVPDQLGAPDRNPMCVDSGLGNVATYLTVDVPTWIRAHFRAAASAAGWAIAGFSEGGTCSIQLGAAHPELFGTVFDISGELAPKTGSIAHTIAAGFAGSAAAYAAAAPVALLAAHAPYAALNVIVAVGANDARYGLWADQIAAAATRAGARVQMIVSPGTAHDWHTVVHTWRSALPIIGALTGLKVPA